MNFFEISQRMENVAGKRMSTMSSAREFARKHGLRVMEYQMEGMVALSLALLFVIREILRFSRFQIHKLLAACW